MAYRINDKITFLHIPKTGGTSITEWIKKYTNYQFDGDTHKHIDLVRADWLDKTFCVVRNPWQRAVSNYFFQKRVLEKKIKFSNRHDFIKKHLEMIHQGFESYVLKYNDHYFNKSRFVRQPSTLKSNSQVSYIGKEYKGIVLRFENLKQDFENIQDIVGCRSPLPHLNSTDYDKQKWKKMYSEAAKEKIAEIWKDDIELFGYTFD